MAYGLGLKTKLLNKDIKFQLVRKLAHILQCLSLSITDVLVCLINFLLQVCAISTIKINGNNTKNANKSLSSYKNSICFTLGISYNCADIYYIIIDMKSYP